MFNVIWERADLEKMNFKNCSESRSRDNLFQTREILTVLFLATDRANGNDGHTNLSPKSLVIPHLHWKTNDPSREVLKLWAWEELRHEPISTVQRWASLCCSPQPSQPLHGLQKQKHNHWKQKQKHSATHGEVSCMSPEGGCSAAVSWEVAYFSLAASKSSRGNGLILHEGRLSLTLEKINS